MTSFTTRTRALARVAALAALAATAACDSILQTEPVTSLPQDQMIQDAATATASLNGAYDALQSGSYYGLSAQLVGDLAADNAVWSGTFQYLGEMQTNRMQADNAEVTALWTAIYSSVNRANLLIAVVPTVTAIPEATRADVMGQAYFIRALGFHNLVKYWGAVPIPTKVTTGPDESKAYVRTPVNDVYTQVLKDLDSAQTLTRNTTNTRYATPTAARALRARVLFYRAGLTGTRRGGAQRRTRRGVHHRRYPQDGERTPQRRGRSSAQRHQVVGASGHGACARDPLGRGGADQGRGAGPPQSPPRGGGAVQQGARACRAGAACAGNAGHHAG